MFFCGVRGVSLLLHGVDTYTSDGYDSNHYPIQLPGFYAEYHETPYHTPHVSKHFLRDT